MWFGGGETADVLAVIDALCGHRNPDGGFGWALEPDARTPESQPLAADFALEIAERLADTRVGGLPPVADRLTALAQGVADHLAAHVTPSGGLPIVLPSVARYPRAAHWGDGDFPPGLNPTAGILARLRRLGADAGWFESAERFCVEGIDRLAADDGLDGHTAGNILRFLADHPDTAWAGRIRAALVERWPEMPYFQLRPGDDYGVTPLDLAPEAGHPDRALFPEDAVTAHLRRLLDTQQDDGGWPLTWTPPHGASVLEWRGVVTLRAIRVLGTNPG
ncbi:hypothetical protein LX16_1842 [Stackebrandtia albiflava]|uniref:Prenyltransferase/squalene oxidase-like repeat protein n=1 Tax=Stackebrandtia albiflava TaxID=406432 RepID=A0A562VE27_9ACTN|nr:hypothetical protein LX16_1842 [Stackebrandtia albiflava]